MSLGVKAGEGDLILIDGLASAEPQNGRYSFRCSLKFHALKGFRQAGGSEGRQKTDDHEDHNQFDQRKPVGSVIIM